jgi:two-component system KDP operon response regulator KdpE
MQSERPAPNIVVVVDDEMAVRKIVAISLREHGYAVVEAAHAAEAIGLLAELREAPAAVVTDAQMPGLSVADLVDFARTRWSGVPILVMSGGVRDQRARQLIDGGEVGFIAKPFTGRELMLSLTGVLGGVC